MPEQRFTATLEESSRGGGRRIRVRFNRREVFGESRPTCWIAEAKQEQTQEQGSALVPPAYH